MSTAALRWDGNPLGPGPIALSANVQAADDNPTGLMVLAASPASAGAVSVPVRRIKEFLDRHSDRLFVSIDVAPVHRQLLQTLEGRRSGRSARDAVWALTRDGRWVDLRLLDRQIRHARNSKDVGVRSWDEVAADTVSPKDSTVEASTGGGDLVLMLAAFDRLRTKAGRLMTEAGQPTPPAYEVAPLSPEEARAAAAQHQAALDYAMRRRQQAGLEGTPDVGAGQQAELPSVSPPQPAAPPEVAPLGHQVEVWAAVILGTGGLDGLTVDPESVPALLLRVHEEHQRASAMLARKPKEVRDCFEWEDRGVARSEGGYPVTRKVQLDGWLRKVFRGLYDMQNRPPEIPRTADGRPPLNPEHWGFWAGCDEGLWAWRQVFRMREAARIVGPNPVVRPRYETAPWFRSMEPNLAVYRSLGVPVFRPREGHVFIAGELPLLRAFCFTTVCVRRGYVSWSRARLQNYVLQEKDPLAVAASELYTKAAAPVPRGRDGADGDEADANDPGPAHQAITAPHPVNDVDAPDAEDPETEFVLADEDALFVLLESDPEQYSDWLKRTSALLDTVLLGLPSNLLTALLRNEYCLETLREQDVRRLQLALVRVAYELESFLEDATADVVASRLGLSANEELPQFMNMEHLEVTGSTLRNDLQKRRRRKPVMRRLQSAAARPGPEGTSLGRQDLYQYRGLTLGGRVTSRAASAAVRRQEVLLTAEEVMLAAAHDLVASGYRLLGLAGSEFVLEAPATKASRHQLEKVSQVVQVASRRILVDWDVPIRLEVVERW
jgi:hypothetical protein